ncbi:MAG: hypothetical protein R2774_00155 [Saprospiraceae bacterium]
MVTVGVNNHNNNSTFNGNNFASEVLGAVWFHQLIVDTRMQMATSIQMGGEFVKFCCDDIPEEKNMAYNDVELRVWDDGNMNGIW